MNAHRAAEGLVRYRRKNNVAIKATGAVSAVIQWQSGKIEGGEIPLVVR